jgi:hypothetical protein
MLALNGGAAHLSLRNNWQVNVNMTSKQIVRVPTMILMEITDKSYDRKHVCRVMCIRVAAGFTQLTQIETGENEPFEKA